MKEYCDKNHMYKGTFAHQAIVSKLILDDEEYQKEILSSVDLDTAYSNGYYLEMKKAFDTINKFKNDYQKSLDLIINHVMKRKSRKHPND